MCGRRKTRWPNASSEEGFVLLGVMIILFLLTISLSVALPKIATAIQRDRELETIQRGKQYVRAVRLYYRHFGKYPNGLDDLLNTSNLRFLRKRYIDPFTGKDDWRIIHLGQATVPPFGFFGQPLTGAVPPSNNTSTGSLSGDSGTLPQSGCPLGWEQSSSSTQTVPSPVATPDQNAGTISDANSSSASSNQSQSQCSPIADARGVVGGSMVGVGLPFARRSLIAYRKQENYGHWEFVYDPSADRYLLGGSAGANNPATSLPGAGSPTQAPNPNSPFGTIGSPPPSTPQ
jgi:type II secretory pathway pseudopilin PulG